MKIVVLISLILVGMIYSKTSEAQIKIGVFADCQYCDCETAGNRYYQNSLSKLTDCISEFNRQKDISFVVGLGDLIDRDFTSFAKVNSILVKSKQEVFQVIGNHDLAVENKFIDKVPEQLNLTKTYYTFNKTNCVKAWINGHNHAGNYAMQNGIHFLNLKGMVDTENENAFSVVSFSNDKIEINGFGREGNRSLPIQ